MRHYDNTAVCQCQSQADKFKTVSKSKINKQQHGFVTKREEQSLEEIPILSLDGKIKFRQQQKKTFNKKVQLLAVNERFCDL
jgi:hypothetical protein